MASTQAPDDLPGHARPRTRSPTTARAAATRALEKALRADDAAGRHRGGHRLRHPGPRRRRLSGGPQVGGRAISNDGQPHYLCANADEGEPGTFKDRWILEHAPHLLLESMLIAAYALQVRHAFVYIRGEFDLPYRRLAGALEEAYAAGYFGERILGTDFACDLVDLSRRRLLRVRRGVGPDHLDRGQARLSAQPAAAPHRARPLPEADRRQQRRDAVQHRLDHRATAARRSRRSAPPRTRARASSRSPGHIERPGRLRDRDRLPVGASSSTRTAAASSAGGRSRASFPAASPPRC